jgi:hypothetical protein
MTVIIMRYNLLSNLVLTRTLVIQQDSKDPQFLSKLNQLGPVRVDHHMQTVRTVRPVLPGVKDISTGFE